MAESERKQERGGRMKQNTEQNTFKANGLYWRANQYRKFPTSEDEIERIDMTQVFYDELDYQIEHGEIIDININAKMRLGKSTCGLKLGKHIFGLLKKHKIRRKDEEFGIENIAHDQSEFDEKMRDPKTTFTIIVQDETNTSEDTGQDTTTIKAQREDFSNVHADRYVHKVSMSPRTISDPNADILLYITATDEEKMQTHAKLYYRYWEGQVEYTQILGYVIIDVSDIITNWVKVIRPIFYEKLQLEAELSKNDKTGDKEERRKILNKLSFATKKIKEAQKKDWYVHYYMKKRKRLDLLTKYKISKPRILKYAPIILIVIKRFEQMIPYQALIKKDIIKNNVKLEMRKTGMPQSIVGEELTTQEVMGVIEAMKGHHQLNGIRKGLKEKLRKGEITPEHFEKESKKIIELARSMQENIDMQIQEYQKCLDLLEEYKQTE